MAFGVGVKRENAYYGEQSYWERNLPMKEAHQGEFYLTLWIRNGGKAWKLRDEETKFILENKF